MGMPSDDTTEQGGPGLGVELGNLLWVGGAILMSIWTLWFGGRLMRSPASAPGS